MNGVRLIQVPYHLGREGELIGAGPPVLAEAIGGESVVVRRPGEFRNEIVDTFDLARAGTARRPDAGGRRLPARPRRELLDGARHGDGRRP
jgi:hypothetical protein